MKAKNYVLRTLSLVIAIVLLAFAAVYRLLQIQIVEGASYEAKSQKKYSATQDVVAARGRIIDSQGNVLVDNKLVYKVVLERAFLPEGKENEVIAKALTILKNNGAEWNDSLPITKTAPYSFLPDSEKAVTKLKDDLGLGVYATVDNCIYNLYEQYNIDDSYAEDVKREIAGVRYEMFLKDFSYSNHFILSDEIADNIVVKLKELSFLMPGIDIIEDYERAYVQSTTAPHVLGRIGAISAEKYAAKKEQGLDYRIDDIIGISGIEASEESTLRGKLGERTITRSSRGEVIFDSITKESQPGNTVMLTFDMKFQNQVQAMLENHISWLHIYPELPNRDNRGENADAGGVVVLDVKTGGVLAAATYPTYDLNDLLKDYYEVESREGLPLFNRAFNVAYRPGSSFKTLTGFAGLAEGIVGEHDHINCTKTYMFYAPSYTPKCLGRHGEITVTRALQVSCNIYFYDVARRVGIDKLEAWAQRFGIGTDLGLEISDKEGHMSSRNDDNWYTGNVVQAGIGQMNTEVTPLHMAVQAMTIANKGVRYQPHIVKGVYDYNGENKISEKQPVIADNIEGYDEAFDIVTKGMILVASDPTWRENDGVTRHTFTKFPGTVAFKTGTPQVTTNIFNSAILGFYPVEDPQIAFGIIVEKGEFSRQIVNNIINAYLTGEYNPILNEKGEAISPFG